MLQPTLCWCADTRRTLSDFTSQHSRFGVGAVTVSMGPKRARRSEQPKVNLNVNECKCKVYVPCRFLHVCVRVCVCQCPCQCQTGLYLCRHTQNVSSEHNLQELASHELRDNVNPIPLVHSANKDPLCRALPTAHLAHCLGQLHMPSAHSMHTSSDCQCDY